MNKWQLIFGLIFAIAAFAPAPASEARYPNELSDFKFYGSARWNVIEPFVWKDKDVFALLGMPEKVYYQFQEGWKLIVLYNGAGECDGKPWPSFLLDTVAHIDLVPKDRVSLSGVKFPGVFRKSQVSSAHVAAPWYSYRDIYGLEYHVFYEDSRDGSIHAGDLKEIVYGPSRKTYESLTGCDR